MNQYIFCITQTAILSHSNKWPNSDFRTHMSTFSVCQRQGHIHDPLWYLRYLYTPGVTTLILKLITLLKDPTASK